MDHDVVLVHVGELLVSGLRTLEGVADCPLHAVPGVDRNLGGDLVGVSVRTEPPMPVYDPSVPSRTTTKSISPRFASGLVTPEKSFEGAG